MSHPGSRAETDQSPCSFARATFFASDLNRTPSAWTTVMVTAQVLLVWTSRTVPDLPAWVPATTRQGSPFLRGDSGGSLGGRLLKGSAV